MTTTPHGVLRDALTSGVDGRDRANAVIRFRYIRPDDDIDGITEMLHAAYAALAEQGMRFVASFQNAHTTRKRAERGETIVALDETERLVGIVTLADIAETHGSPFYDRDDVASFGQFAVWPSHQGRGIGSTMLDLVEARACEKGVAELALDTSEGAAPLIDMYRARGFRFIEYVQWRDTNYRSVIMSKTLKRSSAAAADDSEG